MCYNSGLEIGIVVPNIMLNIAGHTIYEETNTKNIGDNIAGAQCIFNP